MLKDEIRSHLKNLVFVSETDAELSLMTDPHQQIEIREFDKFFERLMKVESWFGEKEQIQAKKFAALKTFLQTHLTDLHIVRIGKINIQIYIVGKDSMGNSVNIKTNAVET